MSAVEMKRVIEHSTELLQAALASEQKRPWPPVHTIAALASSRVRTTGTGVRPMPRSDRLHYAVGLLVLVVARPLAAVWRAGRRLRGALAGRSNR